jgi:hypothetical protein
MRASVKDFFCQMENLDLPGVSTTSRKWRTLAGLGDLYELFYPYASNIHHASPMGLALLVESQSMQIRPAPQLAHIGITLTLATHVMTKALRSHSNLHKVDIEQMLVLIEGVALRDPVAEDGLSSLAQAFSDIS